MISMILSLIPLTGMGISRACGPWISKSCPFWPWNYVGFPVECNVSWRNARQYHDEERQKNILCCGKVILA